MTYPFPTRNPGDTAQTHVEDHNELHAMFGLALPTGLTTATGSGHLAAHNKLHRIYSVCFSEALPQVTAGSSGHLSHHNTMQSFMNTNRWGPRGEVGQITNPSSITGYPGAFTATISAGATTIQSAIFDNPTNSKFRLLPGTYAITSSIQPKSGQEFWCDDGVTITNGASVAQGLLGTNAAPNVKFMNATFTDFNAVGGVGDNVVNVQDADNWEVGYCDISSTYNALAIQANAGSLGSGHRFHHNYVHDVYGSTIANRRSVDSVYEDNEFFNCSSIFPPNSATQLKNVFNDGMIWRHNYFHEIKFSACIWFDTSDTRCITEWNRVQAPATGSMTSGMDHEQDCYAFNTLLSYNTQATGNIDRYNHVSGFAGAGMLYNPARWGQVYGNILQGNDTAGGWGQIHLVLRQDQVSYQTHPGTQPNNIDARLEFMSIHNNWIRPSSTSGKAIVTAVTATYADGTPFDGTPFINNTMQNNFDFNVYDDDTVGTSTNQWTWFGNQAKNWTTWRQVPQVNGTGAFQDINGMRA